jgi:exoribonuclease-2
LVFQGQNGVTSSIKPQQITYIVPGIENFDHMEILDFIQRAHDNMVGSCLRKDSYTFFFSSSSSSSSSSFLFFIFFFSVSLFALQIKSVFVDLVQDPALLEFAWVELLEKNKSVTTEELAEVLTFLGCPISMSSL